MTKRTYRPIVMLDTGEVFETMADAARRVGKHPWSFYKRWSNVLGEPIEFEAYGHLWSTDISQEGGEGRPVFNLTKRIRFRSLKAAAASSGESPSDIADAMATGCLLHGERWSRRPWRMNEEEKKRILCPIHRR